MRRAEPDRSEIPTRDPVQAVTGRQFCAKRGHPGTAERTDNIDPKHPFEMGPMNGRKRRESGLRLV
jgi:hypothetical protein